MENGDGKIIILMLAHTTVIKEDENFFNNLSQPKHKVLVFVFDQYFKAPLLIERMESNYRALQFRCYSRSLTFLILSLPLLPPLKMFYSMLAQAITFYTVEWDGPFLSIKSY